MSLPHQNLLSWCPEPGVILRERVYTPGAIIESHSHEHATLILVLKGALWEQCEGRTLARQPGELHVLPGGVQHATMVERIGARVFLVGLDASWSRRSADRRAALSNPMGSPSGSRLSELGRMMYDEFRLRDPAARLVLEGLMLETLGVLLRVGSREQGRPAMPSWLAVARDRLCEEFANPPTISELAAWAGVSTGHFHRAFRAYLECTPGEYVRRAQIRQVKQALLESHEPISRIGFAAGFSDQAHLTRCFRVMVGVTPARYRRLHGR